MPVPNRLRGRVSAVPAAVLSAVLAVVLVAGCGSDGAQDGGGASGPGGAAPLGDGGRGVRVMAVGDSLTHGGTGDLTWRYRLWNHLSDTDPGLEFVGPRDGVENRATEGEDEHDGYADPGFDTAHDAMWGRTLDDASREIGGTVAEYDPDVLLVLLGINDLGWLGAGPDRMHERVRGLLDEARKGDDPPQVVLSGVLPTQRGVDDPSFSAKAGAYNSGLDAIAEEESRAGARVVHLDIADAESYVPDRDTYDGTHPNARGELKIAAAFADALHTEFGYGAAYPRPLPETEFGPQAAPEPAAELVPGQGAVVTWDPVPGATTYRVRWKQRGEGGPEGADQVWSRARPLPAHVRTWALEDVEPGSEYTFQVRADKGWHKGDYSDGVVVSAHA
ncbi:GDSL-type esterase/lipase family protein [Nocardiopsis sp. RSe5-2]|uniref:GDSL-type esterase/lipase family protein n=1 Tax=Nocardiopsis endophytica TaxID=3018445 RepID=A0ABT4U5R8_9ACTN|nr:GDSL-type esterase/lipase family protein [Nocardiopsis endophytica]MDA2812288.1 GDSL-type esterase/lipase family protein [Nocardiopsis endophytica]